MAGVRFTEIIYSLFRPPTEACSTDGESECHLLPLLRHEGDLGLFLLSFLPQLLFHVNQGVTGDPPIFGLSPAILHHRYGGADPQLW